MGEGEVRFVRLQLALALAETIMLRWALVSDDDKPA